MKKYYFSLQLSILSFFILLFQACLPTEDKLVSLRNEMTEKIESEKGTYAIAFRALNDSSQFFFYNEMELFHAASTMKTPVLYELYRQASLGKFKLTDSILVQDEFRSIVDSSIFKMDIAEDSDEKYYGKIGQKVSIYDLAREMIVSSSNLATNILIEKVGAVNVTSSMRNIGANKIQVLRGVEDLKAYEAGLSNRTNAYDLLLLFEKLGKYELVDSLASVEMINILIDQNFNEIIPAYLPDSVKVAHKTGSITRVAHDSGLVFLPEGKSYVIVLLSRDWDNREKANKLMAELSGMIYEFMTGSPILLNQ